MAESFKDHAARLLREKRAGRWYEAGLRFRCLAPNCVDCCSGKRGAGYVWVKIEEMQALADFLHMELDAFTRKYVRQAANRYSLIEKPNKDCIFLRDGGCSVYPARPGQCRTYPFWHEVMAGPETWAKESTHCPGIHNDAPIVPADEVTRQLNQDRENRGIPARD